MISKLIMFTVGSLLPLAAFANSHVNIERSSTLLPDDSELTIIELSEPVPPRRYPVTTVRLKNSLYDGCLARDDQRSIVRLWNCNTDSRRYNWRIYDTYDPELFYFVNDGYDRRCLAVEGDGKTAIGPTCATVRSHLWRIRLPGSNVNLTREEIVNFNSIPGYAGQIQIVSNTSEGCLGTRDYAYNNVLRSLDCFQNTNGYQVFNVHPPQAID